MENTYRRGTYGNTLTGNVTQEKSVYCICRSTVIDVFMIGCDFCVEWYHGGCIGVTHEEARRIDKYCCLKCKKKNPSLKTTYKTPAVKRKKCLRNKSNNREKVERSMTSHKALGVEAESSTQSFKEFSSTEMSTACQDSTATTNTCFDFVDTTIRKAKIEAYQKFKQSKSTTVPQQIITQVKKKTEQERVDLRQCYGPGCTKASRNGSKYCSDECGIALAKSRILEILPQRLHQWNRTPSAADEQSRKKLTNIRAQLRNIEKRFDELEIELTQLKGKIKESKDPKNTFVDVQYDDTTPVDCILCGAEIQNKFIERHLEQCYKRLERKIFITEYTVTPTDVEWNVFCNHKVSKNEYCKKMKVLCPFHYKDSRRDDERCGYNLGKVNGVFQYCGNIGKTCSHPAWEEIYIAELDLKKINLLFKYKDLINEENKIRREMARRTDVLSLMLHNTIEH